MGAGRQNGKKKRKKDLLRVRWSERSLRKETEGVRRHSQRNGEKRRRRQNRA